MSECQKIYVLELIGDPPNSGTSMIIEVAGASTDRSAIEKLKAAKETWLDEYLGDGGEKDEDDDEDDDDHEDYVVYNTDFSERPYWTISEYENFMG